MSNPHVNDVGTAIELTLTRDGAVFDVSAASVKEIILIAANHTKRTKTAVFTNSGADGKIEYITVAGDLDSPGECLVQARVVLASGAWTSPIVSFQVDANL